MKNKIYTKINEYLDNQDLSEQELLEMANITGDESGIENVVLWIGPNPKSHGMRIKISNIPNKFDGKDCFVLTIPDLEFVGNINKSLITTKKLIQIKEFVTLNLELIIKYSNYELSTGELIKNLKSVQ